MSFHHVALATRDVKATHEFYVGPMGFTLAKVEVAPSSKDGWAKHFFYDSGEGELIAFWDLHDEGIPADFSPAISSGLGLPAWVNHIAFTAKDLEDLAARRDRWLDHGIDVTEIDHGWCTSIYTADPNGIVVEFCATTRSFTAADREEAVRLLADPHPEKTATARITHHKAGEKRG
jgi:catechol 2,3-dioxygenase-like lactoylglutathione lyase family enzyme